MLKCRDICSANEEPWLPNSYVKRVKSALGCIIDDISKSLIESDESGDTTSLVRKCGRTYFHSPRFLYLVRYVLLHFVTARLATSKLRLHQDFFYSLPWLISLFFWWIDHK